MSKTVVFGSAVVDLMARSSHFPEPKETVKGTMFRMGAGGKGFNQCVAAHKAGAEVTMVTKLGRDTFANVHLDLMKSIGMSTDRILYSETSGTGIALILVEEASGQNEILIVSGACGEITEKETDGLEDLLRDADYVLLQLEVNQDANERVVEAALRNNCKVIVNTAPYSPVTDEFLSKLYLVTPNEIEAGELTGIKVTDFESAGQAAAWFRARGVENVLITMGEMGVFVSSGGREEMVPAFRVEAVDTTGAGDAFNGGLLAALSEGKDLWEAARFGNAVGALSVQKLGTAPAMPTRAEIDAFLAAQK